MRSATGVVRLLFGLLGLALVTVGVVYLVMACQNLPGFLGPTPGERSPRTPLGAAVVVLGLITLGIVGLLTWRRRTD